VWLFENATDLEYFKDRKLITNEKTFLVESVGLDLNKFPAVPEPTGTPTVLYAGRILWSKGVGVLVEAVRLLKSQGFDFNCILAGEPDKGSYDSVEEKTLLEWNKEGLVNWVGWQKETAAWYQHANLVVFPTAYGEGVPTVLLEAAASGRAIVTTCERREEWFVGPQRECASFGRSDIPFAS
jgi:glycosyltransferase involved in cell wall biosynthesis